jgi:hypothetical protein
MIVDSSATTGRPASSAARTRGDTSGAKGMVRQYLGRRPGRARVDGCPSVTFT